MFITHTQGFEFLFNFCCVTC